MASAPFVGGSAAAQDALERGLYAPFIFAGCGVTLLSCAVVVASYARLEELRRHPSALVLLRCAFDAVLAVGLSVEAGMRVAGLDVGGGSARCRSFAFFAQFAALGSELCFCFLATDLYSALRNPCMDYKASMQR